MNKRPWYSWVLMALVFVGVGYYIYKNTGEISQYSFKCNYWYLALAFLFDIFAYLAQLFVWIGITSAFDLKAPFIKAGKGYFLSQLGKYVPGKVGLMLVRIDTYRGYSRKKVAVATGFEVIISLAAACLLILIGLTASSGKVPHTIKWISLAGLPIFFFILWRPVFSRLVNLGFKIIKREPLEIFPSYGKTVKLTLAYLMAGLFHGLSLYFVLNSLVGIGFEYYLTITGIYYASGIIGLVAIFTPAGLGVREGILFLALPAFAPEPVVIVAVIIVRLILTLSELMLAGCLSILEKVFRPKKTP